MLVCLHARISTLRISSLVGALIFGMFNEERSGCGMLRCYVQNLLLYLLTFFTFTYIAYLFPYLLNFLTLLSYLLTNLIHSYLLTYLTYLFTYLLNFLILLTY